MQDIFIYAKKKKKEDGRKEKVNFFTDFLISLCYYYHIIEHHLCFLRLARFCEFQDYSVII